MIGGGGISGEGSGDRREVIGEEGILGKKSDWEWGKRGGEMGFRETDGEEFDEVQVALIPIIEDHCQMSSWSVDTSWSVTTPRNQRTPNFIRTCHPMR